MKKKKKRKIPRKGLLFRHEWSELTEVKTVFHMSEKSQTIGDFNFCRPFQIPPLYRMKPFFHMSGKSQNGRDSTSCRPSQILPIYRIIARSLSQILPIINLAGNGMCVKNWILNTNVPAFVQQHGCTRAYAASFSIHLRSFTRQCKVFYSGKAKNAILFFFPSWARDSRQQSLTCFRETPWLFVIGIGNERNPPPTSLTVQMWVFICQEWSPTIAEIWDASGKYKRSRFSRFDPVHPRRSEISTISSFH